MPFLTAVMIMFPTIVSLFFYTFTASYYAFGILLVTVGACLICLEKNWLGFLGGSLCISCGTGIYQAFIPYAIGLLVLYFIKETDKDVNKRASSYLKHGLYLMASYIFFTALYFAFMQLTLNYYDLQLTRYQGIDTMGLTDFRGFLNRARYTLTYFLQPKSLRNGLENSMFSLRLSFLYYAGMLLAGLLSAYNLVLKIRSGQKTKAIFFLIGILILPFSANFIFMMREPIFVHSLMLYGQVTLLIFAIWILERMTEQDNFPKLVASIGLIILLLFPIGYCHYANVCYLKLDLTQERSINYCTSLVAQIKSTPGYKDEYRVAFIEPKKIRDKNIVDFEALQQVNITPLYDTTDFMRISYIQPILDVWCAYKPKTLNRYEVANLRNIPAVRAMPCYPDKGSIQIINRVVVVKFGEFSDQP